MWLTRGFVRVNPKAGFWTASRDIGVQALGEAIAADPSKRVVLLGDINATTDDRSFADITSQMRSAQDVAGDGFGFTWPASFPVVRIDQILVRGVEPDSSWVLPANGSDHRPVRPESAGEHRVKAPIPSRDPAPAPAAGKRIRLHHRPADQRRPRPRSPGRQSGIRETSVAHVTLIARLGGRPPVGGVITKDSYTYTIVILHQEKIVRDHDRDAVRHVIGVHSDKGDIYPSARCCSRAGFVSRAMALWMISVRAA
jgi:Endonuclease/Exonuclease/phosphatase family